MSRRQMAPPTRPGSPPSRSSTPPRSFGRSAPPPSPSRSAVADQDADDQGANSDAGKVPRDKAHLVMADEHCGDCQNFLGDSCKKIQGQFSPDDACVKYFKPMVGGAPGGDDEPDADDQGGSGYPSFGDDSA